jgi:hypothetical protein
MNRFGLQAPQGDGCSTIVHWRLLFPGKGGSSGGFKKP